MLRGIETKYNAKYVGSRTPLMKFYSLSPLLNLYWKHFNLTKVFVIVTGFVGHFLSECCYSGLHSVVVINT